MLEQALTLCTRCLSYDFIGTNPDESSEDVGTIQVTLASRKKHFFLFFFMRDVFGQRVVAFVLYVRCTTICDTAADTNHRQIDP